MAKFNLTIMERRCDWCGRQDTRHVTILFSNNLKRPNHAATRRLSVCGPCGQLVVDIISGEKTGTDRTMRYEKPLKK